MELLRHNPTTKDFSMSIYTAFEERLGAIESAKRPSSQQAGLILADNPGGDPLLGIQYQCDFRYEEEAGAGKMAETFTRAADPESFFAQEYLLQENNRGLDGQTVQANLVVETDELIAFIGNPYAYDVQRELDQGLKAVRDAASYLDGRSELRHRYWRMTVAQMKNEAKTRGLKGYSKLKAKELEWLLADDDFAKANAGKDPEEVTRQAGWFHFGNVIVFEKRGGLFTEVLQKLVEAAKVGQLVVGSGGIGAFGSGFSFFDGRDLTEEAKDQISANTRWYREHMEALKPVAAVVKEGPMKSNWGSAYYFLGKPTIFESFEGVVKYWLNGSSVMFPNGRSKQPSGYYSLQELLDEKYMEDAAADSDESFKRFTDRGSYRGKELTDEEAEAELKASGLRWASKPMGDD